MAQLIRFEPDPDGGGDLGLAHFDDGTSLYTSAAMIPPELKQAQALGPGALAGPDAPQFGGFSAGDTVGGYSPAPPPPVSSAAPPAVLPDMAGTGGAGGAGPAAAPMADTGATAPNTPGPAVLPVAPSVDTQVSTALANPVALPRAPQAAAAGYPGAPGTPLPNLGHLGPGGQQQPAQRPGVDPAIAAILNAPGTYRPGVDPQAMLRNGVMVPTNERVTTEAGVPYSLAEAQVRELANQKVVEAHIATAEAQATRAETQRVAAEAALPALQRQAAANQARFDTINANYQRERAQLQFEIDDFDRNAKVDPDRWFSERGAWGQIGAIVGQALGAYGATLSGGPNWAQQAIDKAIDRDIMAQQATLNQRRLGQKNALSRLTDRYGDVDQAAAALKLSQQQIADKQILAFGAASGRDDIMNNAREWVAGNQQQRVQDELALYHASVGKQQQVQEAQFTQPQAGGPGGVSTDEMLKRVKLLKELGYQPGALGGAGARDTTRDPANPLWVDLGNGQGGYARQMNEATKMREARAGYEEGMATFEAAEQLLRDSARLGGIGRVGSEAYNRAQQLQAMMETQVAKGYGGVITESDRKSATLELPDITSTDALGGELARLNGAKQKLMRTWESKVNSTLTADVPKPPLRATSREHQDD